MVSRGCATEHIIGSAVLTNEAGPTTVPQSYEGSWPSRGIEAGECIEAFNLIDTGASILGQV